MMNNKSGFSRFSPLISGGSLPRGGTKDEKMARGLFSQFTSLEKISQFGV